MVLERYRRSHLIFIKNQGDINVLLCNILVPLEQKIVNSILKHRFQACSKHNVGASKLRDVKNTVELPNGKEDASNRYNPLRKKPEATRSNGSQNSGSTSKDPGGITFSELSRVKHDALVDTKTKKIS